MYQNIDFYQGHCKSLVKLILQKPLQFEWETHGMGFLRLRLPGDKRLHIFDSSLRYPNVSMIHNHTQWSFVSHILSGCMQNIEYDFDEESKEFINTHKFCTIECGIGCKKIGADSFCRLKKTKIRKLFAGESYSMESTDLHETDAIDGTVSIISQYRNRGITTALVFWEIGSEWVSGEPRKSTKQEIISTTQLALDKFYQS